MDGEGQLLPQNVDVNEMMKMKTLRNNNSFMGSSTQQHDDVDIVLLNLGLPLSIVSNAKNLVENENYRLQSMRVNKNDRRNKILL